MLNLTFKLLFYFLLNFFLLSIPINDRTLFEHLSKFTRPYTEKSFNKIKSKSMQLLNRGKNVASKFFSNSLPQNQEVFNNLTKDTTSKVRAFPEVVETIEVESIIKEKQKDRSQER